MFIFILNALSRVFVIKNPNFFLGHRWLFISPNLIDKAFSCGNKLNACFLKILLFLFELLSWHLSLVDTNSGSLRHILDYPLEILWVTGLNFHHLPAIIKLLFGLKIISSIGPHESLICCRQAKSIRTCEAGDESYSLITWCKIFALMSVHVED